MAPKVLISDKLSDAAVQIFKDRGIDVDFQPDLGKDKDKLAAVIGDYDGLAIRSALDVAAGRMRRVAIDPRHLHRFAVCDDVVRAPADDDRVIRNRRVELLARRHGLVVRPLPFDPGSRGSSLARSRTLSSTSSAVFSGGTETGRRKN